MLDKISAAYNKFADWLGILSNIILIGAMMLTVVNIFMRQFGSPFGGTAEVVGYSSAILSGLALAYSQKKKAHIAIDILSSHFPKRPRAFAIGVWMVMGTVLFAMAAWQVIARGTMMRSSGILSDTLQIAFYPLFWVLGAGLLFFCGRVLLDGILSFRKAATGK